MYMKCEFDIFFVVVVNKFLVLPYYLRQGVFVLRGVFLFVSR